MWEIIVVVVIVGVALLWAIRGMVRAGRQKRICSSCAGSGGCPMAHGGDASPPGSECQVPELKSRESAKG